ncbi:RNA polymerase sigma-70 factor (sigma-E family) [Stackebrandtia endophytica]|uniref:RNA polymerase sigma-70 factor (Sigma-E family) n=1 Tax=Stackebrandtia endophytica TaxID=1496996 RepID=A0A543ARE1_9ACTN|nr:SigE family RNA polymerase sigma factor [Stackebrandtia endophytica]TQL75153.1 RNA polymerase sigma-70 factor (sigma-E family) [Stackebrandtia endophytica]
MTRQPHGSGTDFEAFVRARSPALIRSAYLLTGDQQLAEDLVQSALARTYRAWKRVERLGNAEAYTRRAMYHLQVSFWRRRRVREVYRETLPEASVDPGTAEVPARRDALRHALGQLTNRQRAVLVLRFYEDRSVAEAAELLGCGTGTVKSQTAVALQRLRSEKFDLEQFTERQLV